MKFTKKSAWGLGKKRQMMADDTKAYFQEVIRGAGLFGILTRSGSEDSGRGAEGFMDNFEDDSWADLPEPRSAHYVLYSALWVRFGHPALPGTASDRLCHVNVSALPVNAFVM
ncbi:hypothetical protein ElyMa_004044400 [Elysia marginata]|uniref:Uncharacterized protein n=1 Tax=Elysia marginata TaxID=1093978 RepID=A0AAV4G722_9GAST|nr:hypothetical protein ElyMa_004044400 [Elysia marginata]